MAPSIFKSTSAVAASCALLTASAIVAQDRDIVLIVEGARPVAKAMVILEERYGQPITYEEASYVQEEELEDATVNPNAPRRVLVPKRWRIEPNLQLPANVTRPELVGLVNRVLQVAAQTRGLRGDYFRVLQSNYGLHVVPVSARDREGAERPVRSLLDSLITLGATSGNMYSVLQSICLAVSEVTGAKMQLAPIPVDLGRRPSLITAERQRARDVLIRLLEEQGLVRSWHLLHDPTINTFILGIGQPGSLMPLK